MRIQLIDLDMTKRRRPFPNLALMKLSAYFKSNGDEVLFNFPIAFMDRVFISSVFTWNVQKLRQQLPPGLKGGTGFGPEYFGIQLPPQIEHIMPDYALYLGTDWSMGFTSRGCNRRCRFCVVHLKEGKCQAVASIYEFWDHAHNRLVLLDNNILQSSTWREVFGAIEFEGLSVNITQGLDIRDVNAEVADWLRRLHAPSWYFAFDDIVYEAAVRRGIREIVAAGINSRRLNFYVLYGFEEDDHLLDRLRILAEEKVNIYPMAYRALNGTTRVRPPAVGDISGWHGSLGNKIKLLRLSGHKFATKREVRLGPTLFS